VAHLKSFFFTTFTFHIRHIFPLTVTLFFFVVEDISSTFLVWIFVSILQTSEIVLVIYVSFYLICVLVLSSISRKVNMSLFHKYENPKYGIPYVYVSDCSDYRKDSTKPYGCFLQFLYKRA
jgi:hypothetical protein